MSDNSDADDSEDDLKRSEKVKNETAMLIMDDDEDDLDNIEEDPKAEDHGDEELQMIKN